MCENEALQEAIRHTDHMMALYGPDHPLVIRAALQELAIKRQEAESRYDASRSGQTLDSDSITAHGQQYTPVGHDKQVWILGEG